MCTVTLIRAMPELPTRSLLMRRGELPRTLPNYRRCCHASKLRKAALKNDMAVSIPFSLALGDIDASILVEGIAHLGLSPKRPNVRYQSALCANALRCAGDNLWSAAAES